MTFDPFRVELSDAEVIIMFPELKALTEMRPRWTTEKEKKMKVDLKIARTKHKAEERLSFLPTDRWITLGEWADLCGTTVKTLDVFISRSDLLRTSRIFAKRLNNERVFRKARA